MQRQALRESKSCLGSVRILGWIEEQSKREKKAREVSRIKKVFAHPDGSAMSLVRAG